MTAARRAAAVTLYRQGLSVRQVGEALTVDGRQVRRWLAASGVEMRPPGPRPKVEVSDDEVLRMHDEGMTPTEISRVLRIGDAGAYTRVVAAEARRAAERGVSVSDEDLVHAREAGASWAALARRSGQPPSTVRKRVLRAQREKTS